MRIKNEYYTIANCIHCGVFGKHRVTKTFEDMKLLKYEVACCACGHVHEKGINGN